MPLYRKKPVVIEAIQLLWCNWNAICDFVPKPWFKRGCYIDANGKEIGECTERLGLVIQTLESQEFLAQQGDFIIKRVNGEFYACKPDIFHKTYEEVN